MSNVIEYVKDELLSAKAYHMTAIRSIDKKLQSIQKMVPESSGTLQKGKSKPIADVEVNNRLRKRQTQRLKKAKQ